VRERSREAAPANLRLDDVSRHFGSLKAMRNVSFAMKRGELRAVLGRGAGKTTF
jgi:branched-chain amino acid transport system ATP-binding protein